MLRLKVQLVYHVRVYSLANGTYFCTKGKNPKLCTYHRVKGGSPEVSLLSLCMRAQSQLCPTLCDLWAVSHQAPLSMGLSRQEYWSRLALADRFFTSEPPGKLFQPPLVLKNFSFEMCPQTKCYCCDAQLSPNWCYRVTQHGVSLTRNNQCVFVFPLLQTLDQTYRWKETLAIT